MSIYISPVITLFVLFFLFLFVFFRRKQISWQDWSIAFFLPLILTVLIPYRQVERIFYNIVAGFWPIFLLNTIITSIELVLSLIILYFWIKKRAMVDISLFPFFLLIGLGVGLGRFFRDVILVWHHPFSQYFGYSQFSHFVTSFFLAQEVLQTLIFVISAGFLGLGFIHLRKEYFFRGVFSIISGFFIIEIDTLIRTLFQYVPLFGFFSSVYVISLLPLLFIGGSVSLWLSYRRQERRDLESKKENSNTIASASQS